MTLRFTCLIASLAGCSTLWATPTDLFLSAQPLKHPLQVTVGIDAVNDDIDIFDLRAKEGVSGDRGDYLGGHVQVQYQWHPQWQIEGQYYHRDIDYAPDNNQIHSGLVGVRYSDVGFNPAKDHWALRFSVAGNRADELTRSSATEVNQYQFEQINVHQAQDWQLQLDGIFSHQLDAMNQIHLLGQLGYSQVKVDGLDARINYRGCLADIEIDRHNQYQGQLQKNCQIDQVNIDQLTLRGDASEYGLDIQKDLNYDSVYAAIGAAWQWRYQKFSSHLAYQYQYIWRDDLDQRVEKFGNRAIQDNHSIGLKLSYDFHPKISGFVQGEMYQHNFVGHIPLLYNNVTASRLDRRYGLATLGVTFHHF